MSHYIFNQIHFVRNQTVKQVKEVDEAASHLIPGGFNNNIKWNLGHIYLVQEIFAFQLIGETMELPDHYRDLFGRGTKPADWGEQVPSMQELLDRLSNQISRVERLESRLGDVLEQPYTTSSGLTLGSVGELLSFSLYHEGMHFDAIKTIKRLIG